MPIYVLGCSLATVGLSLRAWNVSTRDFQALGILIPSQVFIYSGPPIFSAALFFVFARICYYVPAAAPISPYRIVRTFISLDGLCEMLVGVGTSMFVNTKAPERQKIGQNILRAALILQVLLFVSFGYFSIKFELNCRRLNLHGKFKNSLITLYVCGSLIFIRCVFRLVEFFEGYQGHLITHEIYFYVLECTPMCANTLYMNAMHVSRWLPRKSTIYIAEDGVTELEGEGFHDNRPLWKKITDPYDFEGIIQGIVSLVMRIFRGKKSSEKDHQVNSDEGVPTLRKSPTRNLEEGTR
jgi:hypothetical protein